MRSLVSLLFVLYTCWMGAQSLTIPQIMQGEDFVGYLPENLQVMPNDVAVFTWKQKEDAERSYYKIVHDQPLKLNDREKLSYPLWGYEWNTDKTIAAYAYQGNLFIWDVNFDSPRPVIVNSEQIHNVGWAGESIYFTQGKNLFQYHSKKGTITQLTNFAASKEPYDKMPDYLEKQQEQLFEFIKPMATDETTFSLLPKPIYISDRSVRGLKLDPAGEYVTYTLVNEAGVEYTEVTHHITANGYTQQTKARPKVGRPEDINSFFVYSVVDQTEKWFDFSKLTNLDQIPFYYGEYLNGHEYYQNKGMVFHGPYYNPSGKIAVLEIKSLDNKHRWLVELDLKKATYREIEYQHDEAWIGGPGISGWNDVPGNVGWLNDELLYFQSEESDYSHLYTYNFREDYKQQITEGKFEIHATFPSPAEDQLIVVANKLHPGNKEVYQLNVSKKKLTEVFTKDGRFEPVFTKDGKTCYYLYSYKNKPTELFKKPLGEKGGTVQLTVSTTKEFNSYSWHEPEVVQFMSVDAIYDVYARVYKPEESKKNGAGIIFVHGAGYLQNAHNYWSLYYREYMFHNLLRDQGYTVLDIDYRASEGYGRYWRTAIYRSMGGKDLLDQLAGRDYLIDELGIDENRIGIYGGSYGGFITLMALLKEPGKFACGAALRSVTDWAHYNHEYTSNILNTPQEDSVAFDRSSPINFAENLEDPLIMLHGMVDDNVQFQDVVRLSQRFIELGKQDWEMAIYPVEAHGFRTASSWTDEYTRIYKLFEKHLK